METMHGKSVDLTDFFGTPAIDKGTFDEMCNKYGDYVFLFVTNDGLAREPGYVLEIGEEKDEDLLDLKGLEYYSKQRSVGHLKCSAGVCIGENIAAKRLQGFVGGIGA